MRDPLKKFLKVFLVIDAIALIAAMLVKRFVPEHGDPSSERFRIVCVTDGRRWSSNSDHLSFGSVVTLMGGVELDLAGARPAPEGTRLELVTVMGGVEVRVPDDWMIEVDGMAIMGGHEAPTSDAGDGPHLAVHCTTVMGGVEIVRVPHVSPVTPVSSGE